MISIFFQIPENKNIVIIISIENNKSNIKMFIYFLFSFKKIEIISIF